MALNSLSELVSVTDSAVKSLNSCNSNNGVAVLKHADSPFISPRSIVSLSDSGVEKTQSKSEGSFPRGIESKIKNASSNPNSNGQSDNDNVSDADSIDSRKKTVASARSELDSKCQSFNKMNTSIGSGRSQGSSKYSKSSVQSSHGTGKSSINKQLKLKNFHVQRHGDEINTNNSKENMDKESFSGKESSFNDDDHPQIIDVVSRDFEIDNPTSGNDSSQEVIHNLSDRSNSKDVSMQRPHGKTSNAPCLSLRQGDLNKGVLDPTKARVFDDVYISQFQLTDKQKDLKEALAKRSENNQPRKKQVQPKIIQHNKVQSEDSCSDLLDAVSEVPPSGLQGNTAASTTDSAMTAAVAASAAVAATQPFLKIQHDLESQIKQLVTQLAEIQQGKSSSTMDKFVNNANASDGKRILQLEHQVSDLNERRLEHIESLQQQQLQMQAQLLMMSRSKSPRTELYMTKRQKSPKRGTAATGSYIPRPVTRDTNVGSMNGFTSSSRSYDSALGHSQSSSVFNPNAISKHHNYLSEVRELQGSLLDTPAPRKNIPQPTPYTLPEEQHKHLGFLQELLDKKGTPNHDTTFSVAPGYKHNRVLPLQQY